MVISSKNNEKVKELKKLMSDKTLVFFDNPKLLDEAFEAGHEIMYLIKREGVSCKTDYGGELVELSENVFSTFSSTIASQGVIGVVKFNTKPLAMPKGNFLVLDGLQDPGNVGTLIRSALGANFLDIYLLDSVRTTNDKLVRSSMGAIFKVNLYECSRENFIQEFKLWNLPMLTLDMNGENLYKTQIATPTGIVVGNEGNGVSKELQNISSKTIKIPMQNNLESLNAGVSGSIVMYEIENKN